MMYTDDVIKALKRMLRAHGLTYRDAAEALGLTESSIKRLFADQDFSLKRLERLCELMDTDLGALLNEARQDRARIDTLTEDQEKELVADLKLLVIAVCLLNHMQLEDILQTYAIDDHEAIQKLARLDRLKLIELLPGNRAKLLVSPDFHWRRNGPIQRFFEEQVQTDFFRSSFNAPGEAHIFSFGMLSRRSHEILHERLEKLGAAFRRAADEDRSLPLEKRFGTGMILALRHWEFRAFESLRRKPDQRRF